MMEFVHSESCLRRGRPASAGARLDYARPDAGATARLKSGMLLQRAHKAVAVEGWLHKL